MTLMKKISLILLALWLFACKQTSPITEQPISPEIEAKLYELLKRVPYTSNEYPGLEFFYSNVADIPTHLDPVFGKVDISLLPKTAEFNPYILEYFSNDLIESDHLTQAIHELSPEELARYFDVYISAIDNQYFTGEKGKKTSDEQGAVYVPFKQVTYLLKDGVWSKGASFSASTKEEAATLMDNQISYWKGIIAPYEDVCQVENPNNLSQRIVSLGAYDLEQLHSCDLNEDGQEDYLFSFAEREGVAEAHRRVVILLSGEEMHKYRLLIAPNFCYKDWPLHRIVCKGAYFTLEFKGDNFVAEAYISFKYNKYANNFLLHRYGYIDLSGGDEEPKREVQLTSKDFGEVFFQDFYIEEFDHMIDSQFSEEEEE
ncbi:hypothetical protein HMPREF9071_0569 [Capnocytophaga sp. oral taxon 338 str. F0234]|nr:hypothetical protein HMPREF9071_0569 [Capnocytophaga sp. oral taxon 338 str. F0234]